jgi:hypothetical protein
MIDIHKSKIVKVGEFTKSGATINWEFDAEKHPKSVAYHIDREEGIEFIHGYTIDELRAIHNKSKALKYLKLFIVVACLIAANTLIMLMIEGDWVSTLLTGANAVLFMIAARKLGVMS